MMQQAISPLINRALFERSCQSEPPFPLGLHRYQSSDTRRDGFRRVLVVLAATCSSTRTRRSFENGYGRRSRVEVETCLSHWKVRGNKPSRKAVCMHPLHAREGPSQMSGLRLANARCDQPSLQPSPVSRRSGTGGSLRRLFDVVNSLLLPPISKRY